MADTFQDTLDKLDRALERSKKQDQIDREIAILSIRGLGCQLRGDIEGLKDIVIKLEILQDELRSIRGVSC